MVREAKFSVWRKEVGCVRWGSKKLIKKYFEEVGG
jgi:hypothetical protein